MYKNRESTVLLLGIFIILGRSMRKRDRYISHGKDFVLPTL